MHSRFYSAKWLLLILILCQACNKNETQPETNKIFNPVNSVWWGTMIEAGAPAYFALRFHAGNRLTFTHERIIDTNGIWFLKNNRIFIQDIIFGQFNAEINDSNHLSNIDMMNSDGSHDIIHAERILNPRSIKLEGTTWAGTEDQYPTTSFSISFTQLRLSMKSYSGNEPNYMYREGIPGWTVGTYSRGNLDADYIFGIQISDSVMIGSFSHSSRHLWKAKLQ